MESCGHDIESAGSIKCWKFLYQLRISELLKKEFVSFSYTAFVCWLKQSIHTASSRVASFSCFSLQHGYHSNPTTPKLQQTSNQEQYDQCGNSTEQSQAPGDGYINVRNMLST